MKLSLSWIFDHIDADLNHTDVPDLIRQFNQITAEIESFEPLLIPVTRFVWVQITEIENESLILAKEVDTQKTISLPFRSDVSVNQFLLIHQDQTGVRWVTLADMGSDKDGLLGALSYDPNALSLLEANDYILDIDNKSITHRPDMWGHRGVAREIAAILDRPLTPLNKFLANQDVVATDLLKISMPNYTVTLDPLSECTRFAATQASSITPFYSSLKIASRLARIDSKPIDGIVDLTNYVMFDLGHPMHAFDADRLNNSDIIVRRAQPQEEITLLDNQKIKLSANDIVVANSEQALSLAGIMGGSSSAITKNSHSILLEAAHFNGSTIRRSALYHKKRTESSTRFEKELDRNSTITTLQRFLFLLRTASPDATFSAIASVGKPSNPKEISVTHSYIENRLGLSISGNELKQICNKLEFEITQTSTLNDTRYIIIAPTFRTTKDISTKDDIVEEIGRFLGYDTIQPVIPSLPLKPTDLQAVNRLRTLRLALTSGLSMKEICDYAFFDEQFLKELEWQPETSVTVTNPISENWKHLATTLIPTMLKAIQENSTHHEKLRFFEWARTWATEKNNPIIETKKLTGIMFDANTKEDFYTGKMYLEELFHTINLKVTWHPAPESCKIAQTWFEPYQCAYIMQNNSFLGVAGMVSQSLLKKVSPKGSAFAFELDGQTLLLPQPKNQFAQLTKYPVVHRDISILISYKITASTIKQLILSADQRIKKVDLVDFFQKDEWLDKKSMTFHLSLYDIHKTLTGQEVDEIMEIVTKLVEKQGALIR